ncbi:MAG: c-type cytochrome [Rhodocyclaceae bacterium]|nr:c-type cytochrome [Rhodocyclaceae bacterium]
MHKLALAVVCALAAWPSLANDTNIVAIADTCNSCHGINGVSAGLTMPSIAGQNKDYLQRVLLEQKKGERYTTIMDRFMKNISDEEIAALAEYFAAKEWVPATVAVEMAQANRGRQVLRKTCQNCHGEKGDKNTGDIPRLAGQWPGYIKLEIFKYVDPTFTAKRPSERMAERACNLTEEDMAAVAHFLGTRK